MSQKVLIVDDERAKRIALRANLEDAGYDVQESPDAQDAVAVIKKTQGKFDFVLMDQFFPDGNDGLWATKNITDAYPNVRVIMLTQYGDGESSRKALDAGAFRYIFRPCQDSAVIAVMRAADALKKIEDALKEPSPLRNIIDRAGIGISIIDRSYRILYMNQAQRDISFKNARIGGICWVEYNGNADQTIPCDWCPTKPAMDERRTVDKITVSPVGGELRYFRVVSCPIFDAKGYPLGAIEFVRDVTDQHTAEKLTLEARETKDFLQAALARICSLGFSRARLYEWTEDKTFLRGREQRGGAIKTFSDIFIPVHKDPYSLETLKSTEPKVYKKGQHGRTLFNKELDRVGIDEWLDIPLWFEEECVGKISVDNKVMRLAPPGRPKPRPKPITQEHVSTLKQIAAYAAREIVKERKQRSTQDEAHRLRTLRTVAEQVARRSSKLSDDCQTIIEAAVSLTMALGGHLRLMDGGKLQMAAGVGSYYEEAKKRRPDITLDREDSGSVKAFITKLPHVEQIAANEKTFDQFKREVSDTHSNQWLKRVMSFAAFPILFEEEGMGVLNLQSDKIGFFTPSVCDAMKDFAAMIGPIIRIDRLLDELRRAETRLREAGRMAAHRIGNPNFAIDKQLSLWFKKRAKGALNDTFTTKRMEAIRADTVRIDSILKDLKRFLKRPTMQLPARPIDLISTIRDAVRQIASASSSVSVRVDGTSNLSPMVIDPDLVREVFQELARNALKAMNNKGRISVHAKVAMTKQLRASGLPETSDYALVEFEDTGLGIALEQRDHLFEPFQTTYPDGTGLGLAFVKDAVRLMGGTIRECNRPGLGAVFELLLPVKSGAIP